MFFITDEYEVCGQLCAQPYNRGGAWVLMVLSICHVLPIQLNIWSFYFIPRKFHTAIYGIEGDLINPSGIESPLLPDANEDGLVALNDDDWKYRGDDSFTSEDNTLRSRPTSSPPERKIAYKPPNMNSRTKIRSPGDLNSDFRHSETYDGRDQF